MDYLTVSALNRYVKMYLETNEILGGMTVFGEISNLSVNRFSGHVYFSLKDDTASIRAVCFKNAANRLRFIPKDGMDVLAFGRVSLYERDGQYQLIVEDVLPQGIGAGNKFLEELKRKFQQEGLFDEKRKRSLPKYPKSIAVVTASGSAALEDIKNVVGRRYPAVKLTIFPVLVQGLQAERSIANALTVIETIGGFDAVIIARGGGSKEDLYAFSSEEVVRAAAKLSIPFISAVGHETDIPLLDYVADVRAPTPSAAAELAVPNLFDLMEYISVCYESARTMTTGAIDRRRAKIAAYGARCVDSASKRVADSAKQARSFQKKIFSSIEKNVYRHRTSLSKLSAWLNGLSPLKTLSRGYAYAEVDGVHVGSVKHLKPMDDINLLFFDGKAECTVQRIEGSIQNGRK